MNRKGPGAQLRGAVRAFYLWLGAIVVAVVGPIVAALLVDGGSRAARALGVGIGVAAWIPMIVVVAAIIRAGDEFVQRMHLLAMSLAFAGALVLIAALDWLSRAGFMAPPDLRYLWFGLTVLWFVGIMAAKAWYGRAS